jgi:hypothetical protein
MRPLPSPQFTLSFSGWSTARSVGTLSTITSHRGGNGNGNGVDTPPMDGMETPMSYRSAKHLGGMDAVPVTYRSTRQVGGMDAVPVTYRGSTRQLGGMDTPLTYRGSARQTSVTGAAATATIDEESCTMDRDTDNSRAEVSAQLCGQAPGIHRLNGVVEVEEASIHRLNGVVEEDGPAGQRSSEGGEVLSASAYGSL